MDHLAWRCLVCGTQWAQRVSWCLSCHTQGLVIPTSIRPHSAGLAGPQVTSARDLYAASVDHLPIPAAPDLRVGVGGLVLVAGAPSAGKSTLCLGWLASIRGPVTLLSAEERLGPTLGARLQRLAIRREDLTILGTSSVDDLVGVLHQTHAVALLIDSVTATTLGPRELRHLLATTPVKVLIGVLQVTKDGSMRGSHTLAHEADVLVEVAQQRWSVIKSRYQPVGLSGDVRMGV